MSNKIKTLLALNSVSAEKFEEIIYNTLLNGIFETICRGIKNAGTKTEELSKFRKNKDHIAVTKDIVKRYAKCKLTDEEYEYIYILLRAFFNKGGARMVIPESQKTELLNQQNYKCPYCKEPIKLNNAHLDHIVPWDFVGDSLDGNYQMLCTRCNERKGTSAYFGISMVLYNTIT